MEAEARYTYVGIVVLALVAALVTSIVWLKDIGGRGDFSRYMIHFEQQALDGLQVGADVTLRGIKIGRVEDYALAGNKLNRVRVEVRVDRRAPVRTNTEAVVTRNFVTGIAAISLVNPDPPGGPLVEVPEGERFPVVREGRSDLDEIAGRVNRVGEMASVALNNVNQMLNAENREALMATVRSLRDLSAGLNERLGALDRTLAQVGGAARDVGVAAGQLGRSGERVATVAEGAGQRLDSTLAETDRTLAEARRAFDQIATASGAVQQQAQATAKRLETAAAGLDDQLGAAVTELRLSIESASRVVDRLRDPHAALLGPGKQQLGPGEQRP
jgi:phospholipid/cholesterol/gamma-HCH transport system substrate-binding protein